MTPFDTWYAANVAPTLPTDTPAEIRKLARESMAACWNAALVEARRCSAANPHAGLVLCLENLKAK
jgi:hypothetical protein